jgi:hypothetical protein
MINPHFFSFDTFTFQVFMYIAIEINYESFNYSDRNACAVTAHGELWRWGIWNSKRLTPTQFQGTLLDRHHVVSVALGDAHILALTADGSVFSWLHIHVTQASIDRNWCALCALEVSGHGEPRMSAIKSTKHLCSPRQIEALAGERISHIFADRHHSIVAGWTAGAGNAPVTSGQVTSAQRAYWSWGGPDTHDLLLGHGKNRHRACVPQRVMGIGPI